VIASLLHYSVGLFLALLIFDPKIKAGVKLMTLPVFAAISVSALLATRAMGEYACNYIGVGGNLVTSKATVQYVLWKNANASFGIVATTVSTALVAFLRWRMPTNDTLPTAFRLSAICCGAPRGVESATVDEFAAAIRHVSDPVVLARLFEKAWHVIGLGDMSLTPEKVLITLTNFNNKQWSSVSVSYLHFSEKAEISCAV
jgi:hypothetical protein